MNKNHGYLYSPDQWVPKRDYIFEMQRTLSELDTLREQIRYKLTVFDKLSAQLRYEFDRMRADGL